MELITAARSWMEAPGPGSRQREARPHLRLLPRQYLPRPWLVERLSTDAPVTLVVGPAGTGKTVAVAGWSAESSTPVAWVSANPKDDARGRFWNVIGEALGVIPEVVGTTDADTPVPQGDAVLRMVSVLESQLDHDVVLVIDDYHLAEDADVAASMALWLRHLPKRLRVVIITRHVPMLPLDRMRVAGDLSEIDVDDLMFSRSDAEQVLRMLVPEIDPLVSDAIIAASDGWAAGLRLGAVDWWAARGREPVGAEALTEHLDGYVIREVLGPEADVVRDFVYDVAVVPRFGIGLAEAITERPDAGALLDLARDRGTFVARVGLLGQYEVHSAVRRAVLAERTRRDPDRLRACRRRAAAWLEAHDETVLALEQWLQAGDQADALRLLADRHVQMYDTGHEEAVGDFLGKLSPATTAASVSSMIDLAWCQLVVDVAAFRENVAHAAWWAQHGGECDPLVARRLRALEALASLSQGDWRLAERDARAALDGYASWSDDPIIRTTWNDVARTIAVGERWDDASDEVREITINLRKDPDRTLVLEATRALGAALAGYPVDALRIAGGVRTSTSIANLTMSSCELALAEVIARRELGDASDAEAELERLLNTEVGPLTYLHGLAAAELTQLHLDRGSSSEATRAFCQLERVVTEEMGGPGGRTWLGRIGTVLSVEAGDLDQANRWAELVDDPFWGPVSTARVHAAGDVEQSRRLLDDAVARSPRHLVVLAMLRAGTAAEREEAAKWTEEAVRIASDNNVLQTLASTGQLELIERIAWRLPEDWMARLRRATAVVQPGVTASVSLIEPLTVRERDVLRFLPSRLTLMEIADELYVSVNTLKFHLKVIYRKLGVNSRAEAAEIARSWGRVERR